jgi:hypothetical protein
MFATPRKRARPRFSLLTCHEHGELYFGSHAASLHPTADQAEALSLPPRVSALAGRLIGKGGSGIRELRDVSRASIRILSDCEPGTEQRKLTVSGTPEAIQMALSMISQKLSQEL